MAWTAPRTWVVGEVLTASLLNTHVRDNLNYLKGNAGTVVIADNFQLTSGNGLLVNGSTIVSISTQAFKAFIERQGASSGSWVAGTSGAGTNYAETGVFMQAGTVNLATTSGGTQYLINVTFPRQFSQPPLGFVSANVYEGLATLNGSCTTALLGIALSANSSNGFNGTWNVAVNWVAIGK